MNTLKPLLIFAVLVGVCYGVYSRINHKTDGAAARGAGGWDGNAERRNGRRRERDPWPITNAGPSATRLSRAGADPMAMAVRRRRTRCHRDPHRSTILLPPDPAAGNWHGPPGCRWPPGAAGVDYQRAGGRGRYILRRLPHRARRRIAGTTTISGRPADPYAPTGRSRRYAAAMAIRPRRSAARRRGSPIGSSRPPRAGQARTGGRPIVRSPLPTLALVRRSQSDAQRTATAERTARPVGRARSFTRRKICSSRPAKCNRAKRWSGSPSATTCPGNCWPRSMASRIRIRFGRAND